MEENKELEAKVEDLITITPDAPEAPVEPPAETPPEAPAPEAPPIETPPAAPPVETPAAPAAPEAPPAPPTPPAESPAARDPRDVQLEEQAKTIEELRKMVETVAAKAVAPQAPPPPKTNADGTPFVEPPVLHSFVATEEEMDKALNSKDNFNALLTKVSERGAESVLRMVPQLVAKLADQVVTQKMAVTEFYRENPDLMSNKAFVGMVANDIAAANPGWGMEEVIKTLGPEVRNRLKIAGGIPGAVNPPQAPQAPPNSPAFVPGSGARPSGGPPSLSKMEADISELISGL